MWKEYRNDGSVRSGSNFGLQTIDIYAPGSNITSTMRGYFDIDNDGYETVSGTSMATPFVTGVAALLMSIKPNSNVMAIKNAILNGAELITVTFPDGTQHQVKKLDAWGAFKAYMSTAGVGSYTLFGNSCSLSFNIDADGDYFSQRNVMYRINIVDTMNYRFDISSNSPMHMTLYDSDLNVIQEYQGTDMSIFKYLTSGQYYLRVKYDDPNVSGTININMSKEAHAVHIYDQRVYFDQTYHIEKCSCGLRGTQTSLHVLLQGDPVIGGCKACIICGGFIDIEDGFGQIIHQSITKFSINGSYILPNGIIVLVDEDVDAYFAGTLVFYDRDELPETE